ncbi:DUF7619 domain-containing protein [Winogradskyella helgolandensis]|uniref:DUF7619 domain-containing protein n=1 Tax=Winogradskyella helgolandensis TaxID=2697010 RepID=UPI0015BB0484|nr:T9SS type A sorting domain-containing protein [Winogradskyella helgolandensis]
MKKSYLLIFLFFVSTIMNAQIVDIPDANFKNALLNTNCADLNGEGYYSSDADLNDDGEIQVSEAEAILGLNLSNQNISSLEGLDSFVNIKSFKCASNDITSIDLSFVTDIEHDLIISANQNLISANLGNITSIGGDFTCFNNAALNNLDLGALVSVGEDFSCQSNGSLITVNLQNLYQVNASLSFNNNDAINGYNLSNLYNVAGLFRISGHYDLTSIDINSLNNVRSLEITDNVNLSSLNVPNLLTTNSINVHGNSNLTSVSFDNLTTVTYDLPIAGACIIIDNPVIESINFEGLVNVDGSLTIDGSDNLNTLEFSNLVNAGNLTMEFIEIPNLNLSSLQTVGYDLDIYAITNTLNSIDLGSLNSVIYDINITANNLSVVNLNNLQSVDDLRVYGSFNEISFPSLIDDVYKIDLSDNINLTNLDFSNITSLHTLDLSNNDIINLDISNLESAQNIDVQNNTLTELNLESLTNASSINLGYNNLVDLDISSLESVSYLTLTNNAFTFLDLSTAEITTALQLYGNTNLTTLFVKNGSETNNITFNNCPNLAYICADDFEIDQIQNYDDTINMSGVNINTYCSFVPGGDYFTLEGENKFDSNNDGCASGNIIYPELNFNISDGTNDGSFISNISGDYSIALQQGSYTITPLLENPEYFNVSPSTVVLDFPSQVSPFTQDFCITPNGDFNDLEIVVYPITQAIPGFNAQYGIVYTNRGTTTLSGTVDFVYNGNLNESTFVSAFPAQDNLSDGVITWNYSNLQPFETREIDIVLELNTPTNPSFPLNDGDVLSYFAQIFLEVGDEILPNSNSSLKQVVVNSYDPNDKTCLEGETIFPEMIGEYVQYMIRFENLGTANAINVVVKDIIDETKFDISTLIPLHASHNYVTKITNINTVEFIFENINLPFDDANNDGYILFKIKTKPTLIVGDTFSNSAEIYFDFNFPIITNTAETIVVEALSVNDFQSNFPIKLYPNPAENTLHISSPIAVKSVYIYDINGRVLQSIKYDDNILEKTIDIKELSKGVYFVKLISGEMESINKIFKD